MALPHLRPENKVPEEEKFISVEREMAKRMDRVHPDYADDDDYGNKDITKQDK